MARRKAIIDVGTNSIKFCLAEETGNGSYTVVKDTNDIARLGEGLKETGLIGPEPLERNAQSVANFAAEAKAAGADEVVAVGTMALRTAKNAAAFIARVRDGSRAVVEGAKHEIYRSNDGVLFPWWHEVLEFLRGGSDEP